MATKDPADGHFVLSETLRIAAAGARRVGDGYADRVAKGYMFAKTAATTKPGERCPICRRKNRGDVVGCPNGCGR